MVIWAAQEALHLYCAFSCSVYYCFTHLAYLYLFVSNSTTTDAANSVPPRGKTRDVLLFLDSGRLPLTLSQTALQALHYRTLVLFTMDICSLSRHTFRQQLDNYKRYGLCSSSSKNTVCSTNSECWYVIACAYTSRSRGFGLSAFLHCLLWTSSRSV